MRLSPLLLVCCSLALLAGCGATAERRVDQVTQRPSAPALAGDFSGYPAAERFIQRMRANHGFNAGELRALLSQAQREQWIIELMDRQAPSSSASRGPNGAWIRYRAKFVTDDNIANGARFWAQHAAALERATARYGVPAEYIVAIIGVETRYGAYVGKTRILDALATLAFAYPRRADYFSAELEAFLLMTRDEGIDPRQPRGSYAGAMGLGQFMPSSFQRHAVDFSADGHRDLWHPEDAIGSVANYFKAHGWRTGQSVAVRARVRPDSDFKTLETGFKSRYSLRMLDARGVTPDGQLSGASQVSLLELDMGRGYEYWIGLDNFRVITSYNHSTYYAMAVHQLAQAIRARRNLTGSR